MSNLKMISNPVKKLCTENLCNSQSSTNSASCVLATSLKIHLECPVCLTVPKVGPIYQCRNGHLLCYRCHSKLQRCPLCKIPLEKLRNLLSEQLLSMIEPEYKTSLKRTAIVDKTIWKGPLKWRVGSKISKNDIISERQNTTVEKIVSVEINELAINGASQLTSINWPTSLIMQLMPIRIMRQVGKDFFSNSFQVFLDLSEKGDHELLKKYLNKTGAAGVVHFMNAPACEIHIMVLLYSWEKDAFVGFIPHDQIIFIQRIRDEIKKETPQPISMK